MVGELLNFSKFFRFTKKRRNVSYEKSGKRLKSYITRKLDVFVIFRRKCQYLVANKN